MKKIFYSVLLAGLVMGCVTSCDEDRDSNPVMNAQASKLVLNTPANASAVYDLENSANIVLTTAQPDYGFTASVVYQAYMSLDKDKDFVAVGEPSYETTISIPASAINSAILDKAGDRDLSQNLPVYMKISSVLANTDGLGYLESNVVELNKVLAYVPVVELSLPTEFYIVGGMAASNGWGTFVPFHQAYSVDGMFYAIVYFKDKDNFKISPDAGWKGTDLGFGASVVTLDGDVAGALSSSDDGNFVFNGKSGLYTVVVKAKIANGAVNYVMSMSPSKIYVFGAGGLADDNWSFQDSNLLTDNGDGSATTPAFGGSGELRLAVDCGTDWWKTEFTVMNTDQTLFYRAVDIPNNWASDLGDDYSFQIEAGTKISLDFSVEPGQCHMMK